MLKVLHAVFLKLYSIVETPPTQSEPQEEEDFFLDRNFSATQEINKNQVYYISSVITSLSFAFYMVLLVFFIEIN